MAASENGSMKSNSKGRSLAKKKKKKKFAQKSFLFVNMKYLL